MVFLWVLYILLVLFTMPNPLHLRQLSGIAMLIVPSPMDNKSAEDAVTSFSILVVYYVTFGTLLHSA